MRMTYPDPDPNGTAAHFETPEQVRYLVVQTDGLAITIDRNRDGSVSVGVMTDKPQAFDFKVRSFSMGSAMVEVKAQATPKS